MSKQDLNEIIEDAKASDRCISPAVKICEHLIDMIVPHLKEKNVHSAIFDLEDEGLSLCVQTFLPRRRLTLEVSADGTKIEQIKVDESLAVDRSFFATNELSNVDESIRWLVSSG